MADIRQTLAERENTHGDYGDHADTTQKLKDVIRSGRTYGSLNAHERETLDMIAHKIGRIVSGNPHFHDHWHDIAGYATLSADRNKPLSSLDMAPTSVRRSTGDTLLDRALSLYDAGPVHDYQNWVAACNKYNLNGDQFAMGWRLAQDQG